MTDLATAPSADICAGCGLCCDGTLFSHLGVLDESDLGLPLRRLGVEVIVEADPPVFALPCAALADGYCSIYHQQRPRACGWFVCDLAADVAAGRETHEAARQVIARTKDLRDRVRVDPSLRPELRAAVAARFRAPDPDPDHA